ncbi:MAG: glycosyltransferase family 9 protein [Bacteroidetes bacterium]|nr:glycosyltransferase family 9 protein [Bacteroidota bacterium]
MPTQLHPPPPRVLIARFSALGDIVLMQPLITAMRSHFGEEALIDLVCLARCQEAAMLLSGLNHVHVVQRGTGEIREALKSKEYDYLLDLHRHVRSRSLARDLKVLTLQVDKEAWARWTLIQGWRKRPVKPFVERCFEVVKPFGISEPNGLGSNADNPSHSQHTAEASTQGWWGPQAWGRLNMAPSTSTPTGHVVISLGSSHPGKHLSEAVVDAVVKTCLESGRHIVLVGGSDAKPRSQRLQQKHPEVMDNVGAWNLAQTTRSISDADAVVSGDTVTMHLASAVGTPLGTVWGCTRPALGLAPWRPHPWSQQFFPSDAESRPCSKHGATCRHTRSNDPQHPQRCSQQVDPDQVAAWLRGLLNQTKP